MLPFKKTKALEQRIDNFLDLIQKGALVLEAGVKSYLNDDMEDFKKRIEEITSLEHEADQDRKHVKTELYTYSLMPESRGDVLGLLENLDKLIDTSKEVLYNFLIEVPEIPKKFKPNYIELIEQSTKSVENLIIAARAFFVSSVMIKDFINKVEFYESEVDKIVTKLNTSIFASDLDLSRKQHLRFFTHTIERISDMAEDVSERISISVIKRSI